MGLDEKFWANKRVFLTGHTGFKGGWLSLWLTKLGAEVYGYALPPKTQPNFFTTVKLQSLIANSTIGDIRDINSLTKAVSDARPEIILHLAAQPLVRYSYHEPVETYSVNIMGLVNLLQTVRQSDYVQSVISVATDKCYLNRETQLPYTEDDRLGGLDPYSSSKACAEIITDAYRASFLDKEKISIASVRAGNVIGGGDWSEDRLIPDFIRAMINDEQLIIRSPQAIRPWQHVLECLSGYLILAQKLYNDSSYNGAWNFGSDESSHQSVKQIIEYLVQNSPDCKWCYQGDDNQPNQPHESTILKLDSSKAKLKLNWKPRLDLYESIDQVLSWHNAYKSNVNMHDFTISQISNYETLLNG